MRRVDNPPNRFHAQAVEWHGPAPDARLVVHEEEARSILSENKSPDLPFRFSVNPYRGCYHGCAYCYARPSHQYLDFGAGTDFERQLVVKTNAAELLERALRKPSWQGESITFSGNTDCYQPLEASYELTRRCLEVCLRQHNPITVITKSGLVRRDLELLRALSERAPVKVFLSIPFADDASGRAIEPGASPVSKRFEALAALSEAGIETGVAVAPLIVGLNDRMVPQILERAHAAGARHAFTVALRLPAEVAPVFEARLREAHPDAADKVLSAIRQVRDGKLNDPRFGSRMRGSGPRWDAVARLFELSAARLGINTKRILEPPRPKRGQLPLF
jgi:DNA repair photolyase